MPKTQEVRSPSTASITPQWPKHTMWTLDHNPPIYGSHPNLPQIRIKAIITALKWELYQTDMSHPMTRLASMLLTHRSACCIV